MAKRRQPSGAFFRRFKTYSEPKSELVVKPNSWIRKFHESDGWLYAEVIAFVVVAATIWQIWVDLEDRKTQRIAQAWELVTRVAPGNSGKGPALEFLNSQGIPMVGINLSAEDNLDPSYLVGVNLTGAYLRRARLSEANLFQANLSEAEVMDADLSGSNLMEADLSGGNFRLADL